jgi:D-tyrosyl-tRNA(Tyr) deacylase
VKAVVQRVSSASVDVEGRRVAQIAAGLLVLVGIEDTDAETEASWLAEKLAHLRIFEDAAGKMNLSLKDTGGSLLLVPNFTLAGDARKGRRPSFDHAMRPEGAEPLFESVAALLRSHQVAIQLGVFRAHMRVTLVNDGPITIWLDSLA